MVKWKKKKEKASGRKVCLAWNHFWKKQTRYKIPCLCVCPHAECCIHRQAHMPRRVQKGTDHADSMELSQEKACGREWAVGEEGLPLFPLKSFSSVWIVITSMLPIKKKKHFQNSCFSKYASLLTPTMLRTPPPATHKATSRSTTSPERTKGEDRGLGPALPDWLDFFHLREFGLNETQPWKRRGGSESWGGLPPSGPASSLMDWQWWWMEKGLFTLLDMLFLPATPSWRC